MPAVRNFLQGTGVFLISRECADLLSIFVFRLHPVPFCDRAGFLACSPEKGSGVQAVFALVLTPCLAMLQLTAAKYQSRYASLRMIPAMASMAIGWAFGDAAQQLLAEMSDAFGCEACTSLHVAFSLAATLLSAVLVAAEPPILAAAHACHARCMRAMCAEYARGGSTALARTRSHSRSPSGASAKRHTRDRTAAHTGVHDEAASTATRCTCDAAPSASH
eukprot:1072227-Pleurochrysis_carterae.AAC.1